MLESQDGSGGDLRGDCVPRECNPFGEEDLDAESPETCPTSYIANVIARTLGEACEKLTNGNFNFIPWKVKSVKKFSRPALKSDVEQLPPNDPARVCNELQVVPIDLENLPEPCIDLFICATTPSIFQAFSESSEIIGQETAIGGLLLGGCATAYISGVIADINIGGFADAVLEPYVSDLILSGEADAFATEFMIDLEMSWDVIEDPDFSFVSTGKILLDGSAGTSPNLKVGSDAITATEDESAGFTFEEAPEFIPEVPDVAVTCCDVDFPFFINLEVSDLTRTDKFGQFLQRNAESIPNPAKLAYNNINESWQSNLTYVGFSATAPSRERWNLVFELACINRFNINNINDAIWKFSMRVESRNLTTGEDFLTRMYAIYDNATFCPDVVINFSARINTQTIQSDPETSQPLVLCDDVGLFKGTSWDSDPIFDLRITVDQPRKNIGVVPVGDIVIPVP